MSTRRVYRLDITYPEGCERPGWAPEGWEPQPASSPFDEPGWFRWPAERDFLTPSGAAHRKRLLEGWGCTVAIRSSDPVTWPEETS